MSDYSILRVDPANNGFSTDPTNPTVLSYGGDSDATVYWKPISPGTRRYQTIFHFRTIPYSGDHIKLTLFCSDCHNLNMNWTDNSFDPGTGLYIDPRLNPHSHPINPDAKMAVNGQNIWVADSIASFSSCRGCHLAFTANPFDPVNNSQFPHQSRSHKLLFETYEDLDPDHPNPADPWYTGDPQRQLPNLDRVCLTCHGGYVGENF